MSAPRHKEDVPGFAEIQARYRGILGEEGAALRRTHYAPYFLRLGKNVYIGDECSFAHPERIFLDDDARINSGAMIYGSGGVWIGRHARIGPRCFIHSANHDISDSDKAYFERGYVEAAVHIGDLCLISANVSILPGARIGAGCFVACGTVVKKGSYPEGARLMGVPAKATEETAVSSTTPAPNIVLLTPGDRQWRALAEHLLTSLGLPQVAVADEADGVPESAHSILLFGPPEWNPVHPGSQTVWRLAAGEVPQTAPDLPMYRPFPVVRRPDDGSVSSTFGWSAFWILNRLRKRAAPLTVREFREWVTTLDVLNRASLEDTPLYRTILELLAPNRPAGMKIWPARRSGESVQDWCRRLASLADDSERTLLERLRRRIRHGSLDYADAMVAPERLVRAVLEGRALRDLVSQFTKRMWPKGANGLRLCGFSLAALAADDVDCAQGLLEAIQSGEWLLPGTQLLRTGQGRNTPCLSPLTLALWALAASKGLIAELKPESLEPLADDGHALPWFGFASGEFADRDRRLVSVSLVENWRHLHAAPCPGGMQFQLENQTYAVSTLGLEKRWLEVFRSMQGEAPLLRLRPWPAGYRAAVSLRYDVDRPVTAQRINEIAALQATVVNAPCAAWYYFSEDPSHERQLRQLKRHWQEIGLHVETPAEAAEDVGVTHHSSMKSEYWQGERTLDQLASQGCRYGEFLATRLPAPRPTLLDRQADFWVMPLHFPLEGSTAGNDLTYFNERKAYFLEVLAAGGHAIVASHPDITPALMTALLVQECPFDQYWFATPARVLDRFRDVMVTGNVLALRATDGWKLISRKHIADLTVEVWRPGQEKPECVTTQLTQGRPRLLTVAPGALAEPGPDHQEP